MTATYTKGTVTTKEQQDAVNELLVAFRDEGLKVRTASNGGGKAPAAITYGVELVGAVANKYKVVAEKAQGTDNKFNIQDKAGNKLMTIEVKADPALDQKGEKSATIIAKSITAAEIQASKAQYYDRQGTALSENALSRYFTTDSKGAVQARADAPTVYDAVGNEKTLKPDDIDTLQDLTASLSFDLHVGADGSANIRLSRICWWSRGNSGLYGGTKLNIF